MNELASLAQMVVVIAATAFPIVAAVRFVAGRDGEMMTAAGADRTWPLGVQEEDPQPWRLRTAA